MFPGELRPPRNWVTMAVTCMPGANRRLAKHVSSSNSREVAFRRLSNMSGIKSFYINRGFTRREVFGLAGALALAPVLPLSARASDEIGEVLDVKGEVMKTQN